MMKYDAFDAHHDCDKDDDDVANPPSLYGDYQEYDDILIMVMIMVMIFFKKITMHTAPPHSSTSANQLS